MGEFLEIVTKLAILVFVVTSMATAGLSLGVGDLVAPFRRIRLVVLSIVANFIVAPAIAFALTEWIPLHRPYAIGLLLLGGASGAPFLPKLVEVAKGDLAFSIGLMLLLTVGTIVFMPLVLPLLIPGLAPDPWPILRPLLLTMLLPLAGGMFVRSRSVRWASRLMPAFKIVSNISMLLAVVLLLGLNLGAMIETFGSGAIAIALLFVSLSLLAGYLLGGPSMKTRSVLGLGTGQRNIAAALIVATQNFSNPDVVVMLLVTTFAGIVVLLFAARRMARIGFADAATQQQLGSKSEPTNAVVEPLTDEAGK